MPTHPQDRPADQPFARSFTETYRGHKLRVAKGTEWGRLHVWVNGWDGGQPYGRTNGDAARELRSLRSTVDDAYERPDNYRNGLGEYAFA
jgi:hypothetical protein